MSRRYETAAALRTALDDRLRDRAQSLGRDPNWLRRRLAFTRLLVRLVDHHPDAWVLKGGMAVELRRPGVARSTRDVDLVIKPGLVADPADRQQLHEALVDALLLDPDGDGFPASVIACSSARACAAASRESIASHNANSTCSIRSTTVATAAHHAPTRRRRVATRTLTA
jgi:hypothetical protein